MTTIDIGDRGDSEGLDVTAPGATAAIAARSPLQLFWRRLRGDKVALVALRIHHPPDPRRRLRAADRQHHRRAARRTSRTRSTSTSSERRPDRARSTCSASTRSAATSSAACSTAPASRSRSRSSRPAFSVTIGVIIGMTAGYFRGWVDTVLSRFIDVLLAFPILLLALGLAAACSLGDGCFGGVIKPGHLGRDLRDRVRQLDLHRPHHPRAGALAAREGVHRGVALARRVAQPDHLPRDPAQPRRPDHRLQHADHPDEHPLRGALSFLGVGVQPPNASWGAMLSDATNIFDSAWWYMVFPGGALLLTVLAFNLLGDGLQDALNPRGGR